ncbi:MAG: methylated-DNA--[protein]-cysteine S-methyltransferase [Flavobacteriaceae bacterium]
MTNVKTAYYNYKNGIFSIGYLENTLYLLRFSDEVTTKDSVTSEFSDEVFNKIKQYLQGKIKRIEVKIKVNATQFQQKVWNEVSKIPYGNVKANAQIAQEIGKPNASRAVGTAHTKNPLQIIIPCHRIVKSSFNKEQPVYADTIQKLLLETEFKHA